MNIPLLRRVAHAGEQIRSNGRSSRLGEPAAHVPNPFMHADYLVYDDHDRRVIVSLGTRPKAWQRKIAARNHNVCLVQSFAIRLLRSGSHRAAGGCKSSGDGGTAKSGAEIGRAHV